jgi:hypothetical protein
MPDQVYDRIRVSQPGTAGDGPEGTEGAAVSCGSLAKHFGVDGAAPMY